MEIEQVEEGLSFFKVGITEADRIALWYEMKDLLSDYKKRGKNREDVFGADFPLIWKLVKGIRKKG